MAGEEVRATLRGPGAVLGDVQARDVARLLLGLESALAAAAYVTLGKPRRRDTGRHRAAIEAATRLRFEGVREGSVVAVLALPLLGPDADGALSLSVDDLAGAAFDRLVAAFDAPDDQVDRRLAKALAELAEQLGIGERHDELVLTSGRVDGAGRLDGTARQRMRRLADAPLARQADVLAGTLREADFDSRTARLHTGIGETVRVSFTADLDDQVQEALRGQAEFEGIVTYDPVSDTVRRVELRGIASPETLPFDPAAFWQRPSVAELAEAQGIRPASFDEPFGDWTDVEREGLAAALADLDG
jgi:hypothetical protein